MLVDYAVENERSRAPSLPRPNITNGSPGFVVQNPLQNNDFVRTVKFMVVGIPGYINIDVHLIPFDELTKRTRLLQPRGGRVHLSLFDA